MTQRQGGGEVVPIDKQRPLQGRSYASVVQIFSVPELAQRIVGDKRLEYNEMDLEPVLGRQPIPEQQMTQFRSLIEQRLTNRKGEGLKYALADVEQAVNQVAYLSGRFHPVVDYLRGLEWDGKPRVGELLAILRIAPTVLSRRILRAWLISAVARVMRPGCDVHTVLILVGDQGFKKSSAFKVLAGEDWFGDTPITIGDRDSFLNLHKKWIYEWPELESMQRARSVNSVKAFLTSSEDTFRAPYARRAQCTKRRFVIVGSTNDDDFLTDISGNRRYWPLTVTAKIDLDGLRSIRDQLWAEAVVAFEAGEQWWLEDEFDAELAIAQKPFEKHDEAWEGAVMGYVTGRVQVTAAEVVQSLFAGRRELGEITDYDLKRVTAILRRNGWTRDQRTLGGVRAMYWFPPPARDPGQEG